MPTQKPIFHIVLVDGVSEAIVSTDFYEIYHISGTAVLTTDWAVTLSGTAYEGMYLNIKYRATATLGGNDITFFGTVMPSAFATKKVDIECYYTGSAWTVSFHPAFDETDIVATANILDDNITTAKIAAKAITTTELADLTSGTFLVGNVSNRPAAVTAAGDVTISNAGATVIGNDKITNAMINSAAAIAFSKLATTTASRALESTASGVIQPSATTATELSYLNTSTPGTAVASKALVLGANKDVDRLTTPALYLGAGAGTLINSTAAEINKLSGVTATNTEINYLASSTPGTVDVNKAIVPTTGKVIDTLDITTPKINGVALTATGAEINYLSGVTSNVQTQLNSVVSKTELVTLTANTTVIAANLKDAYIAETTSIGAVTLTLPLASTVPVGKTVRFTQIGTNTAKIAPNAADTLYTIALATPANLSCSGNGKGILVVCDGISKWNVISYE